MKIFVFANQKGGTGKTTTVINIGDAFVRLGKRVLIADLDPQGHAAVSMNLDTEPCVANWLMYPIFNNQPITPEIMNQWIRPTRRENLFLLPGNQMTAKDVARVSTKKPSWWDDDNGHPKGVLL